MLRCRRNRKASQATSDPNVCVCAFLEYRLNESPSRLTQGFPPSICMATGSCWPTHTHAQRHKHSEAQVAESLHAHRLSAFPLINGSDRRSRKRFEPQVSATWNPHLWKAVKSERSQVLHFWCDTWISNVQLCLVHIQVTMHFNERKKDERKWMAHFLQRAADGGSTNRLLHKLYRTLSLPFFVFPHICFPLCSFLSYSKGGQNSGVIFIWIKTITGDLISAVNNNSKRWTVWDDVWDDHFSGHCHINHH